MTKKLQKQIAQKLAKLQELLDQIQEVQIIQPTEPETWDSDFLYNLTAQLKEALKILEDQKINRRNEFGEPVNSWELGLCSLIDEYQTAEEYDE